MKKRKNRQIKLGIFLMLFAGVFFAATLIIPLFDLPTRTKVIASTTSFVLMEVVFWVGGLLVGKELFTQYKQKLDPRNWFKKKKAVAPAEEQGANDKPIKQSSRVFGTNRDESKGFTHPRSLSMHRERRLRRRHNQGESIIHVSNLLTNLNY